MLRRRTTGIVLAVILCTLWVIRGWPLRIGFITLMFVGMWEIYDAFIHRGAKPVRWVGLAYAVLSMPMYRIYGVEAFAPLLAMCIMLGLAVVILRGGVDFDSAVATIFPLIYPGILISMIFPLQDLTVNGAPNEFSAIIAMGMAFLIAQMNDLFAYEIGSKFGKRPFSPVLSPKKTLEGSIAGLIASVIFAILIPMVGYLVAGYFPEVVTPDMPPIWQLAIVGLVGGVAAQVGDLTASMIKRYCGIKDFGRVFPGHGGVLDRMDSVMFTGVVVYMYFTFFVGRF